MPDYRDKKFARRLDAELLNAGFDVADSRDVASDEPISLYTLEHAIAAALKEPT